MQRAVAALPHDAHFMGIVLTALNALSTVHPEQNPALAGQNIYQSKEIQDKQIVRLIGARAPLRRQPCYSSLCVVWM
jgi:citrate synthase